MERLRASIAQQAIVIAQKDAVIAQKDAVILHKDALIDQLIPHPPSDVWAESHFAEHATLHWTPRATGVVASELVIGAIDDATRERLDDPDEPPPCLRQRVCTASGTPRRLRAAPTATPR